MTNKKKTKDGRDSFYTSLEEWEADNFPSQVKRKAQEELEENPGALGTAIADKIFREVSADFLKKN